MATGHGYYHGIVLGIRGSIPCRYADTMDTPYVEYAANVEYVEYAADAAYDTDAADSVDSTGDSVHKARP